MQGVFASAAEIWTSLAVRSKRTCQADPGEAFTSTASVTATQFTSYRHPFRTTLLRSMAEGYTSIVHLSMLPSVHSLEIRPPMVQVFTTQATWCCHAPRCS